MTASSDYESPSATAPTAESDGFEPYDIDRFWPNLSSEEQGHLINVSPGTPVSHPAMPDTPPSITQEEPRVVSGGHLHSVRQAFCAAAHRQRLGTASPAPTTAARNTIPDDPRHRWGGNDTVWS